MDLPGNTGEFRAGIRPKQIISWCEENQRTGLACFQIDAVRDVWIGVTRRFTEFPYARRHEKMAFEL